MKKCLLIGEPVKHSFSPKMHNRAFLALGLDITYLAKRVKPRELKATIEKLRSEEMVGANVTIPYKEKVLPFLDEIDEKAKKIEAVNTIVNEKGKLKGFNTDAFGFGKMMKKEGILLKNKKIIILGAGGVARAITFQSLSEGSKIVMINRTLERAKRVKEKFKEIKIIPFSDKDKVKKELKKADILINTTPLGMFPEVNKTPLPKEFLHPGLIMVDIIYHPLETRLLKEAKEKGCKVINGLEMFLQQGALAFELWTGKKAPYKLMKMAILNELKDER